MNHAGFINSAAMRIYKDFSSLDLKTLVEGAIFVWKSRDYHYDTVLVELLEKC